MGAAREDPVFHRAGRCGHTTALNSQDSPTGVAPYDPLRLCIFATIALLGQLGLLVVAGAVGTWLWLV